MAAGMSEDLTWPAETLESILRHSLPAVDQDRTYSACELQRHGLEFAQLAVFNDRAAVLRELDKLEREFAAAGKPNTAKRIRELADAIAARFRS